MSVQLGDLRRGVREQAKRAVSGFRTFPEAGGHIGGLRASRPSRSRHHELADPPVFGDVRRSQDPMERSTIGYDRSAALNASWGPRVFLPLPVRTGNAALNYGKRAAAGDYNI